MRGVGSLAAVVSLLLASCGADPAPTSRKVGIEHVVLIELKDPSEADALVKECEAMLAKVPSVVRYGVGRPFDAGRPEVSADYDVGLVIGFEDAEGYRAYDAHPDHVALRSAWVPRIAAIRIHDVGNSRVQDRSR
jgi:hypothetical protein